MWKSVRKCVARRHHTTVTTARACNRRTVGGRNGTVIFRRMLAEPSSKNMGNVWWHPLWCAPNCELVLVTALPL